MLICHKGHTETIQVYSVTVMTHVKALQAGHSSQGTSEPITPATEFTEPSQQQISTTSENVDLTQNIKDIVEPPHKKLHLCSATSVTFETEQDMDTNHEQVIIKPAIKDCNTQTTGIYIDLDDMTTLDELNEEQLAKLSFHIGKLVSLKLKEDSLKLTYEKTLVLN